MGSVFFFFFYLSVLSQDLYQLYTHGSDFVLIMPTRLAVYKKLKSIKFLLKRIAGKSVALIQ